MPSDRTDPTGFTERRCSRCHNWHPLTAEHHKPLGDGFNLTCTTCARNRPFGTKPASIDPPGGGVYNRRYGDTARNEIEAMNMALRYGLEFEDDDTWSAFVDEWPSIKHRYPEGT